MMKITKQKAVPLLILLTSLVTSVFVLLTVDPVWEEQSLLYDVKLNADGKLAYLYKGKEIIIPAAIPYDKSPLRQAVLDRISAGKEMSGSLSGNIPVDSPQFEEQWVYKVLPDGEKEYYLLKPKFHLGIWSLLPALITILLCLLTKEPISSLFAGIVVGAILIGRFDLTDDVLLGTLSTGSAGIIILLYLWLLGGLLGIWSKTGAARAFAEYMCRTVVKGPKSAKLTAWFLGLLFFQGGSISTVLVGTTVKPLSDKAGISHEEISYIVDSTASPVALLLAFNPWPAYVQALIFVPGVSFLATESDRISFFFQYIPLSFYSILAVLGTLLLSLNISRFSGKGIRQAIKRAKETGQLDAQGATPLSFSQSEDLVAAGYKPHHIEFILPIVILLGIAIGSFVFMGVPKITWAFATALFVSIFIAAIKGMSLKQIIDGLSTGLKSVVVASVILILAVTVGRITAETGGGLFLVELLNNQIVYWVLPAILMIFTMVIAFSTGTSWGTYAIAFPLAMPLAWAMVQSQGIVQPELFMAICFAAVLNGSIYGDQCSPISDTTILSAMTTGCDLMDHVRTQIVPATFAAFIAILGWTLLCFWAT